MTDRLTLQLREPVQAKQACDFVYANAKPYLIAGHRLTLQLKPTTRSLRQNARYWGKGVLAQIAAQAVVGGRRFEVDAWHELFKRKFLGVVELPNGQVVGKSSTKLGVREFAEFCEQVEAYAASELGVTFYELEPGC